MRQGLISAALLAVPGASTYYAGGAVIYTLAASLAFLTGAVTPPPGLRGASRAVRRLSGPVRGRLPRRHVGHR